jgi:hypothetical protein
MNHKIQHPEEQEGQGHGVAQLTRPGPGEFSCATAPRQREMFLYLLPRINIGVDHFFKDVRQNKSGDPQADDHPKNNPHHFHGGHVGPLAHRLAARGTTDGLRTDLLRAQRAVRHAWDKILAVLAAHPAAHLDDIRGIAKGTIHGNLALVSQLSHQWPRDFSTEKSSMNKQNRESGFATMRALPCLATSNFPKHG